MNDINATYPIGHAGKAWGVAEKGAWLSRQVPQRSYETDVLVAIDRLSSHLDVSEYGRLDYAQGSFPLCAVRSRQWKDNLPVLLVTGGVHGYETSGVHGALRFAEQHMADYAGRANILVAPCVSPWA